MNAARTEQSRAKVRAASVSIASNIVITAAKIVVAVLSGSVSVLSEAVHSVGDIIASVLAFFSVRVSDKPADYEHPYGHGKVESLAGLAESLLLVFAGGWVGYEAILRLSNPETIQIGIAFYVVSATAVLNIFVSRYLRSAAKATDSDALRADAAHITADIVTSVGVLLALGLVWVTGNPLFDPIVALGITLWIFFTAGKIFFSCFGLLIDRALPSEELEIIKTILRDDKNVKAWHQLRTRKSGSARHIDAHILLDDNLSLVEAHEITEIVEDLIRQRLQQVSISLHMEPYSQEVAHRKEAHHEDVEK